MAEVIITKEQARGIAKEAVKPIDINIEKKRAELDQFINELGYREARKKGLPEIIPIDSKWLNTVNYFNIYIEDTNVYAFQHYFRGQKYYVPWPESDNRTLLITRDEENKIDKLLNKIKKLEDAMGQVISELMEKVKGFRTYKRLEKEAPEMFKIAVDLKYPTASVTVLAKPLDDIMACVKKLSEK